MFNRKRNDPFEDIDEAAMAAFGVIELIVTSLVDRTILEGDNPDAYIYPTAVGVKLRGADGRWMAVQFEREPNSDPDIQP